MKSLRTKSQLERVEVGERARVLCARTKIGWSSHLKRYNSTTYPFFIPILPGGHIDAPYISALGKHYHCDYRFWSDQLLDALYFEGDWCLDEDVWGLFAITEAEIVSMCILRRRCYRESPILAAKTRFLKQLEEEYADRCLTNRKCPHQGFKVLPCQKNSSVGICPGHGLTFDLKTGQTIKRAKGQNSRGIPALNFCDAAASPRERSRQLNQKTSKPNLSYNFCRVELSNNSLPAAC